MTNTMVLSERSEAALALENPAFDNIADYYENPWSPDNQAGYVNLSTADNNLVTGIVSDKLRNEAFCDIIKSSQLFGYPPPGGMPKTLATFAKFIAKYFQAEGPIDVEHLCAAPAATGALDIIACAVCNPFDVFLIPSPYYSRIQNDFTERAQVNIEPVSMINEETGTFDLTVEKISKVYENVTAEGRRVRGILLVNPNNPLGTIHDTDRVIEILEYAKKKRMVVIVNEVYVLSVFDSCNNFRSILSYFSKLPDPEETIWLWGLSKEFSLPGLRLSVIYSRNQRIIEAVRRIQSLQPISPLVENVACKLVSDYEWVDHYVNSNKTKLKAAFCVASQYLTDLGVPHIKTQAGFFITCDLTKYLRAQTFEAEAELEQKFRENGVILIGGQCQQTSQPGWFRIAFTCSPEALLEGLKRIEKTLAEN